MTLDEIKLALEAEGKTKLVEDIVTLIESERLKGVDASRKKNKEAEGLRKYKTAFEALGYDGETEIDEFTSNMISRSSQSEPNSLTLKTLNSKLKTLEDQLISERTLRSQAESRAKSEKIHTKLYSTLNDKVYGADLLVKSLLMDNKVDLDGENIVFKNGDEVTNFDNGIKTLLEQRKDILKTNQANGSGSKPNSQIPADVGEIINSKDPKKILANIDKVKAHYGLK
jgi:hypothetical protein